MTRASSGSIVAKGKFCRGDGGLGSFKNSTAKHPNGNGKGKKRKLRTAGFPNEHLVIAWKSVDFPTLASPTYGHEKEIYQPQIRLALTIEGKISHNSALEIVSRSPKENLLFFNSLLWGHFSSLFSVRTGGNCCGDNDKQMRSQRRN